MAELMSRAAKMCLMLLMTLAPATAYAQEQPSKPIRIVTTAVGGGGDFVARLLAQSISAPLGQPVIVDNRSAGVIVGELVLRAPPDGHTLLVNSNSFWIGPLLEKTPYDPIRDFAPITLASSAPNILVVHPSLPVKSVKDLIALAKARPGDLNYGSSGTGGSAHLAAELFKHMARVDIVRVPYKGSAPALIDLLGGRVHLMFSTAAPVTPHMSAGKLRALAVSTAQRSRFFPDLPTLAASGVPGYEAAQMTGVFTSAKAPGAMVSRLNQEMVRALGRADVREKFLSAGVEPVASTPQQLGATMTSEFARIGKLVKEAGIRSD
ncbi:MAG: tripartite tricarboxylate transporter substrate binding protein [Pseudomonadota bacterium]